MVRGLWIACMLGAMACGKPRAHGDDGGVVDGNRDGGGNGDGDAGGNGDGGNGDGGGGDAATDAAVGDAAIDAASVDAMIDAPIPIDAPTGVITGGPCLSGAAGATAYRVRWAGNGSGSTAYPVYEVNGLPDKTRDHTGAYGYQIGFTPTFEDIFLAQGGLRLDGSDFVDIELSTVGVASIANATLSLYGRSFNTTASGSFTWQTFDGTGATPTNFVSNAAPYAYYSADMTTEITPGNSGVLLRIKAGPSSGSLIVNRIELCLTAT